jgi:peptidoglycan hydrolase-like protein with peptidoglycan-binding domain
VDATGQFDDRTENALADFQRTRGLPATGNLSPPTLDALGLDARQILSARTAPVGGDLETGSREDRDGGAARP